VRAVELIGSALNERAGRFKTHSAQVPWRQERRWASSAGAGGDLPQGGGWTGNDSAAFVFRAGWVRIRKMN
jgi:hypothetical protein